MSKRALRIIVGCGLLPLAVGVEVIGATPAHALAVVVNTSVDIDDGSCDLGHCTLREAINATNGTAGLDTISFDLVAGNSTILLAGPLPVVTDPVVIDGTTGGAPRVQLVGAFAGPDVHGLTITGGSTTVRGLVINQFDGSAIFIGNSGGNTIEDSYLGTNTAGTGDLGNEAGVLVDSQPDNTIEGNVISGNRTGVIVLGDAATTGNVVHRNLIGTDATGAADLANGTGVFISGAVGTEIGPGNVISGNDSVGVRISDPGGATRTANTHVHGNRIGTDATGTTAIPNFVGVLVEFAGRFLIEDNLISGNGADGVQIQGFTAAGFTSDGRVTGNRIGTDTTGTADLGNGGSGVHLNRATNTDVDDNVLSGNGDSGVRIDESFGEPPVPLNNRISGNRIGTDATGTADLGNQFGVFVDSQPGNTIDGNVISGNNAAGVLVQGDATTTANVVRGNFIGTDATGTVDVNNSAGVVVTGAVGTDIGPGNVISGNNSAGVRISDPGGATRTADTSVHGNLIGTTAAGDTVIGNTVGVLVEFAGRFVIDDNLISGNQRAGVEIQGFTVAGFTSDGRVTGNRIGTDTTGTAALPNGDGVHLNRATNTDVDNNLISGNRQNGILIDETFGEPPVPLNNRISGNRIGTDATGTAALGNDNGVHIDDQPGNTVGLGNLISGNNFGVRIIGAAATGNVVQGNLIGTDAAGTGAVPNDADGVGIVDASDNMIGGVGAGEGNVIAHNGPALVRGSGVVVVAFEATPERNIIRGNAIFDNSRLGIDLGDDLVTVNDALDADAGPNTLQNFPVLGAATATGGSTAVSGTLASTPSTLFAVDLYASDACDSLGHGEGERFVQSTSVATDAAGNGSLSVSVPESLAGQVLTATAIHPAGDTSEFSACITVEAGEPAGALQFSAPTYTVGEGGGVATITVTRTGGTGGTVTVDAATVGGTATPAADYGLTVATLTFAPGQQSATFGIPIVDDATIEPDETVELALTNPTGGATLGSPSTAVLTITDNDPAARIGTTLTAEPAIVRIGPGIQLNLYRLKARLARNDTGEGIAGQTIVMTVPRIIGSPLVVCRAVTNGAGWAECNGLSNLLTITLSFGYTASYAGNAQFRPATDSAGLIVIG